MLAEKITRNRLVCFGLFAFFLCGNALCQVLDANDLSAFDCSHLSELRNSARQEGANAIGSTAPASVTLQFLTATGKCGITSRYRDVEGLYLLHQEGIQGASTAFAIAILEGYVEGLGKREALSCLLLERRISELPRAKAIRDDLTRRGVKPSQCLRPSEKTERTPLQGKQYKLVGTPQGDPSNPTLVVSVDRMYIEIKVNCVSKTYETPQKKGTFGSTSIDSDPELSELLVGVCK
jgi:hypothetical protein